jgi:hypothetical protein
MPIDVNSLKSGDQVVGIIGRVEKESACWSIQLQAEVLGESCVLLPIIMNNSEIPREGQVAVFEYVSRCSCNRTCSSYKFNLAGSEHRWGENENKKAKTRRS